MSNKKLFLTTCLLILCIASANFEFEARGHTDPAPLCPYKDEGSDEVKDLEIFIAEKQVEFGEFTEELFQKKLATSLLTPIGIEKYNEIKKQIDEKFLLLQTVTSNIATEQFKRQLTCQNIVNLELTNMYRPFEMHIKSTAQVKRTSILIDKYKHINSKLRDLNGVLAETYGYYLTLQKKFKDYVPVCQK